MSDGMVTPAGLAEAQNHWAVQALDVGEVSYAKRSANESVLRRAVGASFIPQFEDVLAHSGVNQKAVRAVSVAYELAAAENSGALLTNTDPQRQQIARAAAFQAYDLLRALPPRSGAEERLLETLTLSGMAYIGERSVDLRNHLDDEPIDLGDGWDRQVLSRLYICWIRLFRKRGWADIHAIATLIQDLRDSQQRYEVEYLNEPGSRMHAFRLVALYNWAKATEVLAQYMLQGNVPNIQTLLDQFMERAQFGARQSGDIALESLLRWLLIAAKQMVRLSLWAAAGSGPFARRFVETLLAQPQPMFELLPPQRAALVEHGLLDPSKRSIIVDMPTSSGKTLLAEFRMLQALNLFAFERGWIAYIAPTRALVAQIVRRLRRDLAPMGLRIESLSAAVDVDVLERDMLHAEEAPFDVLVCTPEKFMAVLRQDLNRKLALAIVDEAQNLENKSRGLRLEMLLATLKREQADANFMLMMPSVPNAKELAEWLAPAEDSIAVASLSTTAWRPNDFLIGMYAVEPGADRHGWQLRFTTLQTSRSMQIDKNFIVEKPASLSMTKANAGRARNSTAAMSIALSGDQRTSICLTKDPAQCWKAARTIAEALPDLGSIPAEVSLVQRFLQTEISPDFEMVAMLSKGIAVHHAGLSDETRSLVEWLAEEGLVRVLCATTTLAQGINFPVSSIFISSIYVYEADAGSRKFDPREFLNLAGRAGRFGQAPVGVIGIAAQGEDKERIVREFVSDVAKSLKSRLEELAGLLQGTQSDLERVLSGDQWSDFRSYIAHLSAQHDMKITASDAEQLLRNTLGYNSLIRSGDDAKIQQAKNLLDVTKAYAAKIAGQQMNVTFAEATGFSPESVGSAIFALGSGEKISAADWKQDSLFSKGGHSLLPRLIGVMLKVPQIREGMRDLGYHGRSQSRMADIASDWVNGASIEAIAKEHFRETSMDMTTAITDACKGIYRSMSYAATWGLSALTKLPNSGLDWNAMAEPEKRRVNLLPAMLYHGVHTESGVAMRMNSVPRSIAEPLGELYEKNMAPSSSMVGGARAFVEGLTEGQWDQARPKDSAMSAVDYRNVWRRLVGLTPNEGG